MNSGEGNRGTEARGAEARGMEIQGAENRQPIAGTWRYLVAAAPMVGFLTLVALVFYLLG